MWNRGQVGRVGLHERPVQRTDCGGGPQIGGRSEGHDPAERQKPTPGQALPGLIHTAGKAVEHRAIRNALPVQHRKGLLPGLAGVDHQRQAPLVGQRHLGCEDVPLGVARRMIVVEVQAGLAHRNRRAQQVGQAIDTVAGLMWMDPGSRPDVLEGLRRGKGRPAVLQVTPDRDHADDPGRTCPSHHLGSVRAQMAVVVEPGLGHPSTWSASSTSRSTLANSGVGLAMGEPGDNSRRSQESTGPSTSSRAKVLNGR